MRDHVSVPICMCCSNNWYNQNLTAKGDGYDYGGHAAACKAQTAGILTGCCLAQDDTLRLLDTTLEVPILGWLIGDESSMVGCCHYFNAACVPLK